MPKICYVKHRFGKAARAIIETVNAILREYADKGFDLTLRQIFYQFVVRDLIPNAQRSYNRLGQIINNARLAGEIDWNRIVDRTRNVRALSHWNDPPDIIDSCAASFRVDQRDTQDVYCEVWIEKDALVGVIADICEDRDVAYFSCRGYTSQSEMWRAAMRIRRHPQRESIIFHLGDHDPSGIDMTRDIQDRMDLFGAGVKVERIALNMDQIEQYKPPPNPTKLSDARAQGYIDKYGEDSWELDALRPEVIGGLITEAIGKVTNSRKWNKRVKASDAGRDILQNCSRRWDEIVDIIKE